MRSNFKAVENSKSIDYGSRFHRHIKRTGVLPLWNFVHFRNGKQIDGDKIYPMGIYDNSNKVINDFNLYGLGFGNWVPYDIRIAYINALAIAMSDLDKHVLKFGKNIGFGYLKISYGARGVGSALAHYEPARNHINLTRYPRGINKYVGFLTGGGSSSFAHEYGHFLDYVIGKEFKTAKGGSADMAYSGGRSTAIGVVGWTDPIGKCVDKIISMIQSTESYKKMKRNPIMYANNLYYFRRNELFARAFEKYVHHKLKNKKIESLFLTHQKYDSAIYITDREIVAIAPWFNMLFREINNVVNKRTKTKAKAKPKAKSGEQLTLFNKKAGNTKRKTQNMAKKRRVSKATFEKAVRRVKKGGSSVYVRTKPIGSVNRVEYTLAKGYEFIEDKPARKKRMDNK